jgi:Amt family ammonium transporter
VIVHNIWSKSGFLSYSRSEPLFGIGMIDFAGSGVVHVTGGFTALIATMLLGPRKGRFYNDRGEKLEKPKAIVGHSKSLQVRSRIIL